MSAPRRWQPLAPPALADAVAAWLAETPGPVRVALDGIACACPDDFARGLAERLRVLGRPVAHVRASWFWHDASLRYEHGREDVESFRTSWLDAAALRREVLDPVAARGRYLPSLRDPATNRSTHAQPQDLGAGVLLVSGALLLGRGLPFDRAVHLWMSPAARARRIDDVDAWTLPAFVDYERCVDPLALADVVIKLDDPARPAVAGLPGSGRTVGART